MKMWGFFVDTYSNKCNIAGGSLFLIKVVNMGISFEEAKRIANQWLLDQNCDFEIVLIDESTLKEDFGWIFFYQSKKYLETKNFRDMLAGNAPLIIDQETGELTTTGTAYGIDYYIAEYKNSKKINL